MMPRDESYYLGIDAGGSKTHALITNQHGHIVGIGRAGPGNWETIGIDSTYDVLLQAMMQALSEAGLAPIDLGACGYGLAGLDWPSDEQRLAEVIKRLGPPGPFVLVNDAYSALSAGSHDSCGIAVIAGTGTVIVGRNRAGEHFRTFGLDPMFGDFGGAANIVELAIRAVAFAYLGRGQPTALADRFAGYFEVADISEFAERLSRQPGYPLPDGRAAPLIFETAEAGDLVAQDIIRYTGDELGHNAAAIARKLGLCDVAFDVVMAGGVFRSNSALLVESLMEQVHAHAPWATAVVLQAPPVVGSVLLAMESAGSMVTPEIRTRLLTEAQARFEEDIIHPIQ